MTCAPSFKKRRNLFFLTAIFLLPGSVLAQTPDDYVPPPMFDAPQMNAPRDDLLPPVVMEGDPAIGQKNRQQALINPPLPKRKPGRVAAAIPVKSDRAPDPAKVDEEGLMPAARVTHAGTVKGPSNMPSVPTGSVQAEALDEPVAQTDILARHEEKKMDNLSPAAAPVAELASLPLSDVNERVQKLSLAFPPGQTELPDYPLGAVINTLKSNPGKRLLIQSYATPQDDGASSDMRISLARAMTIRKIVMAQGIPSLRLDIRAQGAQTNVAPKDRVDLMIYAGQNE